MRIQKKLIIHMDKKEIQQIVIDQQQDKTLPSTFIDREAYRFLTSFLESPQVVVLTGIRRCGKSTWMKLLRNKTKESDYYLNFDDDRLVNFKLEDCQRLVEVMIELFGVQNTFYFDEIQNCLGWERFVRRLHNEGKKVIITGSNAKLLSQELGTHLTGRHFEAHLYPYSFREYIQKTAPILLDLKYPTTTEISLLKKSFSEYKMKGGFPEYVERGEKDYLHGLYENILYKDIIVRHKIEQISAIKSLAYYLATNNAKEFTYNSLRKLLSLSNTTTISDYCHFFENSFLCFIVNRYAVSVRTQLHSPKKIYFIDSALAQSVGFRFSEDHGRMLENIIYLQLKRRDKYNGIYYHKEKKECDFLVTKGLNVIEAIQVCTDLSSSSTREREIQGLLEAMHLYDLTHGTIINEEESSEETHKVQQKTYTIRIVPAWQWLLQANGSNRP